MDALELRVLNSLVKLLPDQTPAHHPDLDVGLWSALRGEKTAIQLAARWSWRPEAPSFGTIAQLRALSPLREHLTISRVVNVPVRMPAYPVYDEQYLTVKPGLLPDLLQAISPEGDDQDLYWPVRLPDGQWQVFWLEIDVPARQAGGTYPLQLTLTAESGTLIARADAELAVIDAFLPDQTLRRTEWFHADCLANYYRVPVFSEEHWQIIADFIKMAVDHGVNMLLTPIFTPPLDTAVGGERPTVQLIGVEYRDGKWHFDFALLRRWLDLAQSLGVCYFEMSHLFSQWGAKAAPKIIAAVDGCPKQVFGWDTPATGPEYRDFLAALLPQLTARLTAWGLGDRCYFHVSDEPGMRDLAQYMQAKALIKPWLGQFPIIDALSDYDFYTTGAVEKPIPANNHIQPFLDGHVPDLWTYYCCGQYLKVSNQFIAMPSARNRIIGVQLYLYRIEGFLHWGYNFYNSLLSKAAINPYLVNDADGAFPAGDPFMVYPGLDGRPEASLRLKVFREALNDLAALNLLESLTSREAVVALIMQDLDEPITFDRYPAQASWLIAMRNRVNQAIAGVCRRS